MNSVPDELNEAEACDVMCLLMRLLAWKNPGSFRDAVRWQQVKHPTLTSTGRRKGRPPKGLRAYRHQRWSMLHQRISSTTTTKFG